MSELEYNIALALIIVPAVALLAHFLYFSVFPRWAIRKYAGTDLERLGRCLERVVATPSLMGSMTKQPWRVTLAHLYFERAKYAEAAAHLRISIDILCQSGGSGQFGMQEAFSRHRLAECLELLAQFDEATDERRRATKAIELVDYDTLPHFDQEELLGILNAHEEVYAAHEKALKDASMCDPQRRVEGLTNLIYAAYRAGRPADLLRSAQEVIALNATGNFLSDAHTMAGLACDSLGRYESSEPHYRRAYDVFTTENNTPRIAISLCNLACCFFRDGKFSEAEECCLRALAIDPDRIWLPLAIQSQIFHASGRHDDALAVLPRVREAALSATLQIGRSGRKSCALDAAILEIECGRTREAWALLHEAMAMFTDDMKLAFRCESASVWVLAARGLTDESQRLAAKLDTWLRHFERDVGTCRGVLYDLGMAACVRLDRHAGITAWTRYLALNPAPIDQPTACYQRGECHRLLGEFAAARNDYNSALAVNVDTHYSRLARQRLEEIEIYGTGEPRGNRAGTGLSHLG